jgi:hypothetical protein
MASLARHYCILHFHQMDNRKLFIPLSAFPCSTRDCDSIIWCCNEEFYSFCQKMNLQSVTFRCCHNLVSTLVATLARVHTLPYFDECIHKTLLVSQRDYRYPMMNGNIFQHFSCHSVLETANSSQVSSFMYGYIMCEEGCK